MDAYSNLAQIFCNGLVLESATCIAFFTMLLKNPFHSGRWMLLEHIYRAGRAANHQSTTDSNN